MDKSISLLISEARTVDNFLSIYVIEALSARMEFEESRLYSSPKKISYGPKQKCGKGKYKKW